MRAFSAHHLSYQLPTGKTLFTDISCTLNARLTGLIGRNGIGKSILGQLLSGQCQPSSGTLQQQAVCGVFKQQHSDALKHLSLAQGLDLDEALAALAQIEQGATEAHWFDVLGERWSVRETFADLCHTLNIPATADIPLSSLSGGQLARVRLWRLFNSNADWLLLDEPSNHLDAAGKHWLLRQMQQFSGQILLISHDRFLLQAMQEIWELDSLGLQVYGGGYDVYLAQKQQEQAAIECQLASAEGLLRQAKKQQQLEYERAQQRATQGRKLARKGSQAKVILDRQKERASASTSTRSIRAEHQQSQLNNRVKQLKARQAEQQQQKVTLGSSAQGKRTLVQLINGQLPYGNADPINLSIKEGAKLRLTGTNGSGKSTLLRVLHGSLSLLSGERLVNGQSCYLDQHFSLLNPGVTLLNSLTQCTNHSESDNRTLLAQAGFRGDQVHHLVASLSGGERMKLALLMVSHQPNTPLLLLDEADNHLDIESQARLADALNTYPGTLVLVTHDEVFAKLCEVSEEYQL
ncbi:ATP-binding cassette domain-containing protein [Nitrincola sp.]|uniref:ATP-binding cassette domain-containing protein n=1 Tax=Nitrincola sp. TaxID=1926584 RepID=UPI003A923116